MSASVTTAPARTSFGRIPAALAAMALVVVLAVTIALVAMNGTKAAAPAKLAPVGAPPPVVIDHSYSSGEKMVNPVWAPSLIPSIGGFGGPRLTAPSGDGVGNNGPHLRAQ
jgi:hypothetical protein